MGGSETDRPASKVARLIDEHGLDGLGAELEARWTGQGAERTSLRDLAEFFNKRVLEQVLIDADMSALESDVETTYRNLTGETVSAGVRTDTRNRLKNNGVDVEALEREFVSYQAIRSYLTQWRGAEYETLSDEEKRRKDKETIQRLLTRAQSVTEERLETLRDTDRLALDAFEVFVDAQVFCQECGSQHTVGEIIDQGGCDCLQE